jgi:RNA polymerase sigma-70 factor (ECF subfamily)
MPPVEGLPAESDPDAALMLAFAAGGEEAFVQLYQRYRDRILTFTLRMLGERARAEDATQEVFLKLYRARAGYQATSRFSTYLYRIATNHCLNQRARSEHRLVDLGADPDPAAPNQADQQQTLTHKQLRAALLAALGTLPERQRAAFLLVHYEGLSYREAADSIEVSEAGIKSLIHRARTALMAQLQWQAEPTEVQHAL